MRRHMGQNARREFQALGMSAHAHGFNRSVDRVFEAEVHPLQAQAAAFDLGDIKDVVDRLESPLFTELFRYGSSLVCGRLCGWALQKVPFSACEIAPFLSCLGTQSTGRSGASFACLPLNNVARLLGCPGRNHRALRASISRAGGIRG